MSGGTSQVDELTALARGLPASHAQQLLSLRELQLRRARTALAEAQEAVDRAQERLDQRHERVTRTRTSRLALLSDMAGRLARDMPQWTPWAIGHRAWLDEQLEREEYALINDERVLEQAQDRLAERRRELARCEHRESLALDLMRAMRRQRQRDDERRQDTAREDQSIGGRAW